MKCITTTTVQLRENPRNGPDLEDTYTSTSTLDETFTKILVYPIPSDGTLYIESNFTEKSVVQITDLLGNII